MPEFTLPEGPLRFHIVGPIDSRHPPVVFVHGLLTDHRLWMRAAEQLGARGYCCVLPDLPLGSHVSPMNDGATLDPRVLARMIRDLIVELALTDVTLVGNDTGGALCQFVIDAYPDLVGRLVLTNCDAFEKFPPAPFKQLFAMMRGPRIIRAALVAMRPAFVRQGVLGYGLLTASAEPELTRSWIDPCLTDPRIRRDLAALLRTIDPADLVDVGHRLPRFAKPVAVVWGQADRAFTPALGRRLADRFPQGTYVPVPRSRTFVALDDPDAVTSAVESISTGVRNPRAESPRP